MEINCGAHNIDKRFFLFVVKRPVFIAFSCICAVVNHGYEESVTMSNANSDQSEELCS
jgi:hypothetical protein